MVGLALVVRAHSLVYVMLNMSICLQYAAWNCEGVLTLCFSRGGVGKILRHLLASTATLTSWATFDAQTHRDDFSFFKLGEKSDGGWPVGGLVSVATM